MSTIGTSPSLFRRLILVQLAAFTMAIVLLVARHYYLDFVSPEGERRWPTYFAQWIARLATTVDPTQVELTTQLMSEMAIDGMVVPPQDVAFKVWRSDGQVVAQSHTASWPAPVSPQALVTTDTVTQDGWHIGAAWSPNHAMAAAFGVNLHDPRNVYELMFRAGTQYLVIVLGFLGGSWVALRLALRPVRRVACSIAHRSPGDLTLLETDGNYRELRPIVESFNTLLSQFRELLETERAFVANAAHELRTPIAAISAQAHVLISEPDDSGRRTAAAALQAGVRRSARVIRRLLLLSKLDTAPEQFETESGDVAALIREIAHAQQDRIHAKDQQLTLDLQSLPRRFFREALEAAVECLLDNAIRYTSQGARIRVEARAEADETVIAVCDDGPGIPPESRARAFNRFDRLGRSDEEGSGLGLAIVRHVSQLHGGTVQLRAPADGVGSVFEMRLPLLEI